MLAFKGYHLPQDKPEKAMLKSLCAIVHGSISEFLAFDRIIFRSIYPYMSREQSSETQHKPRTRIHFVKV
jgi:hypothetical protein